MFARSREKADALWVLEQYTHLTRVGELSWRKVHGRSYRTMYDSKCLEIEGCDECGYEWYRAWLFDEEADVVWRIEVSQDDVLPELMAELFRLAEGDAGRDSKGYVQVLKEAFERAFRPTD